IGASTGLSERVHRLRVIDHLPIYARIVELLEHGLDVGGGHKGIVCAMQHEDLGLNVLAIGGSGRIESPMEAGDSLDFGTAASQFEHAGAAKAVADGCKLVRIYAGQLLELLQPQVQALAEKLAIGLV